MPSHVEFSSQQSHPGSPEVVDIDPKELWEKRDLVYIVDVRGPDEYHGDLGHIPGAHLIVLDTLAQRLDEIPKDQTVVFVCKSGGRSGRATAFAKANGLNDVYNMKGGMLHWNELGLTVEK